MIRFEGVETFLVPPAEVYAKLSDAGWLAQTLPDAVVTDAAPDRAGWKVRPKFTFMAGSLDTIAEVTERTGGDRVRYRVASKGVGSSSTVNATLTLVPVEGGTTVTWVGDLTDLGGLLKMVPRGLIQAAAQSVIADVWKSVHGKLSP